MQAPRRQADAAHQPAAIWQAERHGVDHPEPRGLGGLSGARRAGGVRGMALSVSPEESAAAAVAPETASAAARAIGAPRCIGPCWQGTMPRVGGVLGDRRRRDEGRRGACRGRRGARRGRASHRPVERARRCSTGSRRRCARSAARPTAVGVGVPSQIEFATGTVLSSVNIPLEGCRCARSSAAASACRCSWTTTPTAPRWPRPSWSTARRAPRDAHAGHRRRRGGRDRRPDLPRRTRAGRRARPRHPSRRRPAVPGPAARTAAASRRSAAAPALERDAPSAAGQRSRRPERRVSGARRSRPRRSGDATLLALFDRLGR